LRNLEILDLSNNNFKSIPKTFEKLASLKNLFLDGNPLKGIPGFVYELKKLLSLDIRNTNITESGILKNRLKKGIEIHR